MDNGDIIANNALGSEGSLANVFTDPTNETPLITASFATPPPLKREPEKYEWDTLSCRGKAGLSNLGNTCFLNSAIQCLSHTECLTNHFIFDGYLADINVANILGTGGKLANVYADLMKKMWFGISSSVRPTQLQREICRFAPYFSGRQQHDSQELLAFLIDGLHEDLNRVMEKPYVGVTEANGRPDAEVAEEAWSHHLQRNKGVFVDHLQGQFKSTVACVVCHKASVTFDPFNCIQLELPLHQTATQCVSLDDCFDKVRKCKGMQSKLEVKHL